MQDFNSGKDRASKPVESSRASAQPLPDRMSSAIAAPSVGRPVDSSREASVGSSTDDDSSAAPRLEHACVLVLTGSSIGRLYRFTRDPCRIGRAPHSDITLAEESVAWDHAEVRVIDGGYLLRATDPSIPTYVNGVRITEHFLAIGDRIELGDGPILKLSALSNLHEGRLEQAVGQTHASGSPKASFSPSKRPA